MRADRLLALLMFLQNRGRTTADRLAEELEVSRRTIIRDLYALRVAGFPVYTERGAHGGIYLHKDFQLKLTDLTPDELAALFAFSIPTPLTDLGMGAQAKTALRKLATSLPSSRQDVERNLRSRLYLDPNPWQASQDAVPTLSTLRQAVWEDRWVHATLLRVRQVRIEHEMAPYSLVAKGRTWYVVWRGAHRELHIDRVSDVIEAELTDRTFSRPAGFDIEHLWTEWAAAYEADRRFFPVTVRVRRDARQGLERDFGGRILHAEPSDNDEWERIELEFDHFEHARAALLAYGGSVDVLKPEALRRSIADFAERIVERYRCDRDCANHGES
jgi:predicted DNA-binding transcriptional regulator YafY